MPSITAEPVPTGGAIFLQIEATAPYTLSRSADGGQTWTVLDTTNAPILPQGGDQPVVWIDVGDASPTFLDFSTSYTYEISDVNGTAVSAGIIPAAQVEVYSDNMTYMMVRLIQGAAQGLVLENKNWQRPSVVQAMPLDRVTVKFPLITINLDLVQQDNAPIGRNVPNTVTNQWTIPGLAHRRYSIHVLTQTVAERDFYHNVIIGLVCSVMNNAFSQFGINMDTSYSYQAVQGQEVSRDSAPGFYYSQIMFDMTGPQNINVVTTYPIPQNVIFQDNPTGYVPVVVG